MTLLIEIWVICTIADYLILRRMWRDQWTQGARLKAVLWSVLGGPGTLGLLLMAGLVVGFAIAWFYVADLPYWDEPAKW